MPRRPDARFAPEAMPWVRSIEGEVDDLTREMSRRAQNEMNANKAQNGTLSALAQQISRVDAVVSQLVTPVSASDRQTGFVVSDLPTDVATARITVPEGCSRAVVWATFQGGLQNAGGGSGWSSFRLQGTIAGSAVEVPVITSIDTGRYGTLNLSWSREVTGLTPGSELAATTQLGFVGTASTTQATVSALALFMP